MKAPTRRGESPAMNAEGPPCVVPAVSRVRRLLIRRLGRAPYHEAVQAMRSCTDARRTDSPDELWLLEHPPIFTLGQAGRRGHVHDPGTIPVVRSDRGGQATYHGPGQLVAYLLLDLRRAKFGTRRIVEALEQAVIDTLAGASIEAARRSGAPGVYVEGRKIASVGLRVHAGCTFHGISINVDLDLAPFARIAPCGYAALPVTRIADLGVRWSVEETGRRFAVSLGRTLACALEWDEARESSTRALGDTRGGHPGVRDMSPGADDGAAVARLRLASPTSANLSRLELLALFLANVPGDRLRAGSSRAAPA